MKILITCPNINSVHGGIRIIVEWANRLKDLGHEVTIFNQAMVNKCNWLNVKVPIITSGRTLNKFDCVIIGSPHASYLLNRIKDQKCFIFLQMLEHYFRPHDVAWSDKCRKLYQSEYPVICLAEWQKKELITLWGRNSETHVVGNGVNFEDFPVEDVDKDYRTILLESPEPTNPTKDIDRLALKVAKKLKEDGYYIIGYGSIPVTLYADVLDEYFIKPDLATLNELYRKSFLMLKATVMDGSSTAPFEAATKQCFTIRAIDKGDEWANHISFFSEYELEPFLLNAKEWIKKEYWDNYKYSGQSDSWDYWMTKINEILCG